MNRHFPWRAILAGLLLSATPLCAAGFLAGALAESNDRILVMAGAHDPVPRFNFRAPEEWCAFWESVEKELQTRSLDDLAWRMPERRAAELFLQAFPGHRPAARWLADQADTLALADDICGRIEAAPARLPLAGQPAIRPPRWNDAVFLPPALLVRRTPLLDEVRRWKREWADRKPIPVDPRLIIRLKSIFRQEGVPPELVWIAEVESSLDPRAQSRTGAVGLFQFMPMAAERFGLRAAGFDDRTNPEKSARAAAQYLRFLHDEFGSWSLALAAYNAGEGFISRSMKKNAARSFEDLYDFLPGQTRDYVPKVMGLVAQRERLTPCLIPPPADVGS